MQVKSDCQDYVHDPCFVNFFRILEQYLTIPLELKSKFKHTSHFGLLPKVYGIYFLLGYTNEIEYIGEASNIYRRLIGHQHRKCAKHIYYLESPFKTRRSVKIRNTSLDMLNVEWLFNRVIEPKLNKGSYFKEWCKSHAIEVLNIYLKMIVHETYPNIDFDKELHFIHKQYKRIGQQTQKVCT